MLSFFIVSPMENSAVCQFKSFFIVYLYGKQWGYMEKSYKMQQNEILKGIWLTNPSVNRWRLQRPLHDIASQVSSPQHRYLPRLEWVKEAIKKSTTVTHWPQFCEFLFVCKRKLVHVPFVQYFRTLFWDDVTIIYLLFSFCWLN